VAVPLLRERLRRLASFKAIGKAAVAEDENGWIQAVYDRFFFEGPIHRRMMVSQKAPIWVLFFVGIVGSG
jgi:hypothetical protein